MLSYSAIPKYQPEVKKQSLNSTQFFCTLLEETLRFSPILVARPSPMRSQSWQCLVAGGGASNNTVKTTRHAY